MSISKNENIFFPVIKIYYALIENISEIEDKPDGSVEITFESGEDWNLIYSTKDSIVYNESSSIVNEGTIFKQSVEFNNPGDELENGISINDLMKEKLIIKIEHTNGSEKIIGNLENPTKLLANFKSGNFVTGRNIKIERESSYPAPYIYVS